MIRLSRKTLKFLGSHAQSDGGIYAPNSFHRNYETCPHCPLLHRGEAR